MIEVNNLSKSYGSFTAVPNVSFSVKPGNIVGLLGPNGAGKTTIMKMLTAYHRPSSGTAIIDGHDVVTDPVGVKKIAGYLPEGVPLYNDMTVLEYLRFAARARYVPKNKEQYAIEKALDSCGLDSVAKVRIEKLSKGYKQRTGLAQAILHEPSVLILDEPTTGLDPNQILEIRSLIRHLGSEKTVILSTHILQEVEALCSMVLILNEGKIVAEGSADKIAQGMQGEEYIHCVFNNKVVEENITSFSNMVNAKNIKIESEKTPIDRSCIEIAVSLGDGDRASEAIFDWACSSGTKLLELKREKMSMEDIFVRLTNEEIKK